MEKRDPGKTGERVSVLGLGGGRLEIARSDDVGAHILISESLDLGINYIDTSLDYGDGASEERIGWA